MTQNVFDLDQMIKSRFRIFEGVRPKEEDEKLFNKIWSLCIDELLMFFGEYLSEVDQKKFLEKLKQKTDNNDKIKVFSSLLRQTKPLHYSLFKRLSAFLDNLYFGSLTNLESNN